MQTQWFVKCLAATSAGISREVFRRIPIPYWVRAVRFHLSGIAEHFIITELFAIGNWLQVAHNGCELI